MITNNIFLFLATGVEETEAIATTDVLRRANLPVTTVSITGKTEVTGAHGITMIADALFEAVDFSHGNMLVLPGGMPGATNLGLHKGLSELLKQYLENDKFLAAICAAPKVLGKLNLLQGKVATCYPGFEEELLGAVLSDKPVVQDGNLITAKGPAFAIDFGLKIVEVLQGRGAAAKIASGMLVK
jgi:4-methyl-5(b-hydroxyethyl)-thiazole monophosphate biosynthesis